MPISSTRFSILPENHPKNRERKRQASAGKPEDCIAVMKPLLSSLAFCSLHRKEVPNV